MTNRSRVPTNTDDRMEGDMRARASSTRTPIFCDICYVIVSGPTHQHDDETYCEGIPTHLEERG